MLLPFIYISFVPRLFELVWLWSRLNSSSYSAIVLHGRRTTESASRISHCMKPLVYCSFLMSSRCAMSWPSSLAHFIPKLSSLSLLFPSSTFPHSRHCCLEARCHCQSSLSALPSSHHTHTHQNIHQHCMIYTQRRRNMLTMLSFFWLFAIIQHQISLCVYLLFVCGVCQTNRHRNISNSADWTTVGRRMWVYPCVSLFSATAQWFFLPALFKHKLHGAAYGKGIYLSPISSISFGYSGRSDSLFPTQLPSFTFFNPPWFTEYPLYPQHGLVIILEHLSHYGRVFHAAILFYSLMLLFCVTYYTTHTSLCGCVNWWILVCTFMAFYVFFGFACRTSQNKPYVSFPLTFCLQITS